MITDRQEKMLKRVIACSELLKYDIIGLEVTALVWMLLMMIDDLVLNNPGIFMSGIIVFIIFSVIDCILMIIHGIYVRVVTVKKDWLDMTEKAGEILSETEENEKAGYGSAAAKAGIAAVGLLSPASARNAAHVGATAVLIEDMSSKKRAGAAMAALFNVKLRSGLAAKLALVLIPVIALGAAYGVRCLDAAKVKEAAYAAAGPAVNALVSSLMEECERVIGDDPYEDYDENGYFLVGYLDDSWNNYISVEIDNAGLITAVNYFSVVDVNGTKEENLISAEERLGRMYSMVIRSGVEAESDQLLEEPVLTDTFKESFIEGSYYENIYERADTFALYYFTDDEEDYDDGGSSYFRISIKG